MLTHECASSDALLSPSDAHATNSLAAPTALSAEHAALVFNVIGHHPASWYASEYRKAYILKHGASGDSWPDWDEPKSKGFAASRHCVTQCYSNDGDPLADLRDLLQLLASKPSNAIVLGSLRHDKSGEPCGVVNGAPVYLVDARDGRHYGDGPTRLFPLDIDDLDCDDIHEAGDAIDDFISTHLTELEGCAYVWHHTGSSGVRGVRVRLWFLLAEPRYLAAMRVYVATVNERAGRPVVDASIYTPSHLVFTADPELQAADGSKLPRRVPSGVCHVAGDMVSADAFADVLPGSPEAAISASAHAPLMRLTKKAEGELLASIGPGNYALPIHGWLCGQAWKASTDRRDAARVVAIDTIRKRIAETSEPDQRERRLRGHGNPRTLTDAWDKAIRRLDERLASEMASAPVVHALLPTLASTGIKIDTTGAGTLDQLSDAERLALVDECEAETAPLSVDEARVQLVETIGRVVADVLLRHVHGHWLFTHAPGLGKSRALEELTRPGYLTSYLVRIFAPNHRLAAQLVADLKLAAIRWPVLMPAHGDVAALVRHHKGRDQPGMCEDAESKPKADRAAKLGVSPKKAVCGSCKSRDGCPWLKQFEYTDCGIIVEAHAAAVAGRGERRADLVVIDESIIASLFKSDTLPIAMLDNVGQLRSALDGVSLATVDLRNARGKLVAALRAAAPTQSDKPALLAADGWDAATLGDAIQHEEGLQDTLATRIINREDAGKDAKVMREQFAASKHAAALYGAIEASVRCGRSHVSGVTVFTPKDGAAAPSVKYTVRAAEATRVFGDASITLDGTADASVWRAAVSPDGTPFEGAVYGADVALPDGVTVYQYADKRGAKSNLLPDLRVTDAEKGRNAAMGTNRQWMRAALDDAEYEAQLRDLASEVAADDAKRAERKRRGDSLVELIVRKASYLAATHRPVTIDGKPVAVLLVAQKAIIERLRPSLPAGVAVEHFGALRGLNEYANVPAAMIVGRPRPSDIDLELMTEALHSHDADAPLVERYEVSPTEGRPWLDVHPDARVAALQSQITTAEVRQAMARVRMYNRGATNPVEVHVFGQCDLGLPPERVLVRRWQDAQHTPAEIALARGCVFDDARLNRRAYGDLFPKGDKRGSGRVDIEHRAAFNVLLGNLARHAVRTHVASASEITLNPNSEVRAADSSSLLGLERNFDGSCNLVCCDALDYSGEGLAGVATRRHKLVKVRVAGPGYARGAIVNADWTREHVERLLGSRVEVWKEATVDTLEATAGKHCVWGAVDVR